MPEDTPTRATDRTAIAIEMPGAAERPLAVSAREPREVEELFLYAFATQAEVLHHVRTETVSRERQRVPEILASWTELQARVDQLMLRERRLPETIRTRPLAKEHQPFVERVAAHPLFQKTFQHLPVSFEMVDVDKLIAPQRTVNVTHVQRTLATMPSAPRALDLPAICLWPERSAEPIQHLEVGHNTHVFSSPMTDMRFLDSAVREVTADDLQYAESGGLPVSAVMAFVGYGCSTINAFRVGTRLILNNGFHRVYALRSLGVTEIPVAVQHVHNVALELPAEVMGIPSSYLLRSPRPVLIKDFFEPGFTLTFRVRERLRVVKVSVNVSKYDVLV